MDKMALSVNETDLRKLYGDLERVIEKNSQGLRTAVNKVGVKIESKAKQNVVRVTGKLGYKVMGNLSSSIMANYSEKGFSVRIGTALHYAPYVEFGTGTMVNVPAGLEDFAMQFKGAGIKEVNLPPRPFLFPAFEENIETFIEQLEKMIQEANR
jgi:HK97 gp10 family phage protein